MEYIINVLLGKDYFSIKNAYLLSRSFHCLMLCVFMCFSVKTASVSAQTKPSDSETQTLTVKEALEQVKNRLEYSIWFNVQDIDLTKRVVVKFHNRTVNELLDVILKDQPLSYQISGKVIQIFRPSEEQEKKKKQHVVTGVVSDAKDGEPLIGCTVRIKGQSVATITDIDGNYVVEVGENDVLVFSYIGYETMQKMPGASGRMNIQLANSSTTLDDVIVTGYQVIKKYNVTGAVNTISSKEIDLRSSNTLQGVLEGAVPGLTVYNNQFRIRGGASLAKGINNLDVNNKPLFIVDDFEVEELPENMDMVETITVLKDAAAAAIWGSRAANGVVVITTKKGKANEFRISYSGNVKVSKQPNYNDLDRVNSEQLVSYDREAFMGGYYFPGFFDYSKNGYSLSQEIIKDYLKEDMGELTKEELKEMDQRLALLSQQNNWKQIEDNLLRNAMQHHHMLSISGGSDKIARRWQKEGDEKNTDIACLPSAEDAWVNTYYRSNAVMYSSNSIRSGNMIRLREILFNYECPQSWLKHTPLRRLSLTAQFNNVWLWTKNKEGYDPEAVSPLTGALSFGQPFSFTAGVKVDF